MASCRSNRVNTCLKNEEANIGEKVVESGDLFGIFGDPNGDFDLFADLRLISGDTVI